MAFVIYQKAYIVVQYIIKEMTQALEQLGKVIIAVDNTYELASICTMTVAIQSLDGLLAEYPKKVAEHIDQLINIVELTIKDQVNYYLLDKAHILDFIVTVVEKYPKLAKSKKARAAKLFKLAMDILCSISSQTSEQWMSPPDGFKAEQEIDVDSQTVNQVMSTVDALSIAITFEHAVKNLQSLFLEYVQNTNDWRVPYSALVVASQISIEGANIEALDLIMQHALAMTEHFHPKVRYAALQLIGQYSDDIGTEFQQAYYSSLIPVTIKLLKDPVPRVVAHTFACLTNFFQKCKLLWKLQNILGQYLTPIFHYIKTGSSWVKEAAISTLSSLGETEDVFGPNLTTIFELAAEIVTSCIGKLQYKQLLNQTLQLISILLAHQKKQLVEPYLPQFINLLFAHKDSIDRNYFLECWNRLCCTFNQFTDISQIYNSIFEIVKQIFVDIESLEDCSQGLNCLRHTLESNKSKAAAFKTETAQFAKQIFQDGSGDKVKEEAILLLVATSTTTKPEQPSALANWFVETKQEYDFMINTIQNRLEYENHFIQELPYLFDAVEQLIVSFKNCLTGDDIIALSTKQLSLVKAIQEVYHNFNTGHTHQQNQNEEIDSGQQQANILKLTTDALQQALQKIADILEQLMKQSVEPTTKQAALNLYQAEIYNYINKDNMMVHFGLSLAVEIISIFSYTQIKADYPKMIQILCQFIESPLPRIRNVIVYGFKVIFTKIPANELGSDEVSNFLQYLSKAFTTEFPPNPSENDYPFYVKHCKDNVISALGVLLKNFAAFHTTLLNSEVYKFWLSNLPLNTDKKEGNDQQEILIELLNTNPALIIKQANDLLGVCQIYAKFLMKRGNKQYKEIIGKTKQSLLVMKGWSLFQESSDYLWNSLSETHKKTLMSLMAS